MIKLGQKEAHRLNCNYYGSEHFFLGVLHEEVTAGILNNFGRVALERVKKELSLLNRCPIWGAEIRRQL